MNTRDLITYVEYIATTQDPIKRDLINNIALLMRIDDEPEDITSYCRKIRKIIEHKLT